MRCALHPIESPAILLAPAKTVSTSNRSGALTVTKNRLALTVLLIACCVAVGRGWVRHKREMTREVKGTILRIDKEARIGVLRVGTPTTAIQQVTGDIAKSCAITVNGKPATLSDVRVGDRVKVKASVRQVSGIGPSRDRNMEVLEIHVKRPDSG